MSNFIIENIPYEPEKITVISNYVLIQAGEGKYIFGIDKEDLEKWLKEMKTNERPVS